MLRYPCSHEEEAARESQSTLITNRLGRIPRMAKHGTSVEEEHEKWQRARDRDVHDVSKETTLPIVRHLVQTYVTNQVKAPWYIDLLNINFNNHDLAS